MHVYMYVCVRYLVGAEIHVREGASFTLIACNHTPPLYTTNYRDNSITCPIAITAAIIFRALPWHTQTRIQETTFCCFSNSTRSGSIMIKKIKKNNYRNSNGNSNNKNR